MKTPNSIPALSPEMRDQIQVAITNGPVAELARRVKEKQNGALKPMLVGTVRVGRKGGLPYEFLSTDVHTGCLPVRATCYGNCSQAWVTVSAGYDFGDRHLNHYDPKQVQDDIAELPAEQKWIRQGWTSDISLTERGINMSVELANELKGSGRFMLLISKFFRAPEDAVLRAFQRANVELRASLSALDFDTALTKRLDTLSRFRAMGGTAVPYLMTTKFSCPELHDRQEALVSWIRSHDMPGGEHPLRLDEAHALLDLISAEQAHRHPKFPTQMWFGNQYQAELPLPAPPSLKSSYPGLSSNRASEVDWEDLKQYFDQGTPSKQALDAGVANLSHPNLHKHGTGDI